MSVPRPPFQGRVLLQISEQKTISQTAKGPCCLVVLVRGIGVSGQCRKDQAGTRNNDVYAAAILSLSDFFFLHGEHLTKSCFDSALLFVYKRGVHFIASRHTHRETTAQYAR